VRLLQEEDAKHAEQISINKTLAITALNTEKAQAAEDLNNTAKQNDESKAALTQMNTELANLDASLDGLEKAIARTEKKLKSFPSIIDGANTRIINSQSELNSATASLRQIQANLGNQDSSLSARALDAEQRAQRHVAEAQDYLKEKKSDQNSTQDELAKQKLALEELTREREKLNNQINSFARTITHTENTIGTLAAKQKAVEDGIEQIKETPTPAK
jgi:chromosome segregation ATPase